VSVLQLAEDSLLSLPYHVCLDVVDAFVTLASFVYVNTVSHLLFFHVYKML